jgi:NRPS condensation-like uncharacterized protein
MTLDGHEDVPAVIAEVARGQRSRPLLLLERTMYREGNTPFTSVFTIKLVGKLDEVRLHQALARVQNKHPLLRCTVEEIGGTPHFVLQEQPDPISLRTMERVGEDDWQAEVRREWVTPFSTQRGPLVRFVWLRSSEVSEFILVGHHCICDGHTGINLLRELLSVYDQPEQDLGRYDALGTVEDIVPSSVLQDRRLEQQVRRKIVLFRLLSFLKKFGRRKPAATPGQMYFHRWHLDHTEAQAITSRCSAEGVTVLAAMSMACMQAFRDVRGAESLNKTYAMVNARRFLPQLRTDAMFGLVPGIPLQMKDVPPPQEMSVDTFWTRARAVKADMTIRIDRLGASLYSTLLTLERMHDKYSSMVADTESAPAVRHITLSNMGRIDLPQQYRDFRLELVYSPLVMVSPTPANTVVLSSFAGEMELAIVSDESSLPYAKAREIEARAMQILQAAMTVPERRGSKPSSEASAIRMEAA